MHKALQRRPWTLHLRSLVRAGIAALGAMAAVAVLAATASSAAYGAIVRYEFSGTLDTGPPGIFLPGRAFFGSFAYDDTTVGVDTTPQTTRYDAAVVAFAFRAGDFVLGLTAPRVPGNSIFVDNFGFLDEFDLFVTNALAQSGPSTGLIARSVVLELQDRTGSVFPSTALPRVLDLPSFSGARLDIDFADTVFDLRGTIDTLTAVPPNGVPEPATLALVALAWVAACTRRARRAPRAWRFGQRAAGPAPR
jgi:hypothetical protein